MSLSLHLSLVLSIHFELSLPLFVLMVWNGMVFGGVTLSRNNVISMYSIIITELFGVLLNFPSI